MPDPATPGAAGAPAARHRLMSAPTGEPAVTGASGTITYRQLAAMVDAEAVGYQPGERVAISYPDPLRTVVSVLASYQAGATAVVVDPTWPATQVGEALRLARAGEVIAARPATHPFWIGFTSGSAGIPRPIGRTAASWATSFPLVSERTGITAGSRVLVPGLLGSSLFLFGALHALWAGAHLIVPGRWDPERLPPADAVHCVPAMLTDLVTAEAPPRLAVCGGAAIPDRVRQAARNRGVTVRDYYGATELSFVAWRDPDGRLLPFPGVEIAVRDGEIWARSRYLSQGYAAAVTGPLRFDDAGYATVGDLGRLDDGELTVLGRGDGTILTGGAPVLPEDVESVLRTVDGVRDVVVVGTPHERLGAVVTALVEPAGPAGAGSGGAGSGGLAERGGLAALRQAARARLAAAQQPRLWYTMPALPRTASGKPARQAIAAGLADGSLPARPLR